MKGTIKYLRWAFTDDQIQRGNLYTVVSLPGSALEANTIDAEVVCDDPSIIDFERNTPLLYYPEGEVPLHFYVQDIQRLAPKLYRIYATSIIGRLAEGRHYGGMYVRRPVPEVVKEICGDIPVIVKTVYDNVMLYGWLPIAVPRDNLSQVLLAIGATVKEDMDGVLRVEPLWDGVCSQVGENKMYTEAGAEYASKVSQVIVTEHQYVPGTEEKQLFDGTSQEEDVITFSEPMHSLTATGFRVLDSGANYARISAGTGVLTGKVYIHNTRQLSREVAQTSTPNIKRVETSTLVSLVNSQDVANRMSQYYRLRETVSSPIVYQGETPGDVLLTYHPFDKVGVNACLESADITLSNTLKAQVKALVGYIPPQPDNADYYDGHMVLTGRGKIIVQDEWRNVRGILISAAQGGKCGRPGEPGSSANVSFSVTSLGTRYSYSGYTYGPGGKGGLGGEPGHGGRVLDVSMEVTPGQIIEYSCGVGGLGAVYDPDNLDAEGQEGGDTTFGPYSTANGSWSDNGYLDVTTGEVYGARGLAGLPGGDGAGQVAGNTPNTWDKLRLVAQATAAVDEDGNTWAGGNTRLRTDGGIDGGGKSASLGTSVADGYIQADSSVSLGSGGAAGSRGTSGEGQTTSANSRTNAQRADSSTLYAWAIAAAGLAGADAVLTPRKAPLTTGGRGGYGGGGGSSSGLAVIGQAGGGSKKVETYAGTPGPGGAGSQGGQGGDGLIILFYSAAKTRLSGPLVTADGQWFLGKYIRRFIV